MYIQNTNYYFEWGWIDLNVKYKKLVDLKGCIKINNNL